MMAHICWNPSMIPYEELKKKTKTLKGWKSAAIELNRIEYTYYDKTAEERAWIKKVERLLKTTMPLKFKTGAHLIAKQVCFMGEDLYVYDQHIVPAAQCRHKKCGHYRVVSWKKFYCAHCKKEVNREQLIFCGDEKG